jgi:hypothetical protein
MGYNARVEGELEIVPPLSWPELKANPMYKEKPGYYDIRIDVDEEKVDTPDGELIKRTGITVSYGGTVHDLRAYSIEDDLEKVRKTLPKGTELKGWLDCLGEDGAVWRVAVYDGCVVRVEPKIVWPEWMQ